MAKVRLAVADEAASFRADLIGLLEGMPEFEVVGEADTGRAALELVLDHNPDVLLLAVNIPGMEAPALIRRIRDLPSGARCRVLMLATSCNEKHLFNAISAGADDYLLKGTGKQALRSAILNLHQGSPASAGPSARPNQKYAPGEEQVEEEICLSAREMEVLGCLVQGRTTLQIAAELFISENTVKTHVRHILGKLSASSRVEAVSKAAQLGLI